MKMRTRTKFYQQKLFYVSCLCTLLAIVSIVSVDKFSHKSEKTPSSVKTELADNSDTTSKDHTYQAIEEEFGNTELSQGDTSSEISGAKSDSAIYSEPQQDDPLVADTQKDASEENDTNSVTVADAGDTTTDNTHETDLTQSKQSAAQEESQDTSASLDDADAQSAPSEDTEETEVATDTTPEEDAVAVSNTEDQGQGLTWPINGDILLTYSMESPIYFATLHQYKCNPALCIAGKVDDPVVSSCDCEITEVKRNKKTGLTITATSGDYTYVYGQLKDPKVAKGDVVKEGTALASLAEPSSYYEKEGCNLYFQIKDGKQPVDPLIFLK